MKDLPRRLSGVWGRMLKTPRLPSSTSAADHRPHVLAWWATTHVGSERIVRPAHARRQCVSACLCYRAGRDVFGRGTIKNQTPLSAKDKFNSILLIFGSAARVNQGAVWLAVCAELPDCNPAHSQYVNRTPHSGVRGKTAVQVQWGCRERDGAARHHITIFFNVWWKEKKNSQLLLFLLKDCIEMYRITGL